MKLFDILLASLLPSLILIHLLVAPYSKVEESFNLQATHDILAHGTPLDAIGSTLRANYDHFEFPGAVPRTFTGAVLLAGLSQPLLAIVGWEHAQFIVRALLGLFNAVALLRFKNGVDKAFGRDAGKWYILLQASQFHVIYYASRTLPNMFAFGLGTLALRELLPMPTSQPTSKAIGKRHRLAIYLFVLAGVIFRSELALLLFTNLAYLIIGRSITLETIIWAGFQSAFIALASSVPIDSYFWQKPIWPELAGFFYNAIQGKSSDWGTSPFHAYFTSFLPKLLLNPSILLVLIPLACYLPSTRKAAAGLLAPTLSFVAIYSLQPHKEARFIIYAVPPLTACAAIAAAYITRRRTRSLLYQLLHLGLIICVVASLSASLLMLAISSLNYPGGEALWRLHNLATQDGQHSGQVRVHMDVLSCMTGVTRFQQDHPSPPFLALAESLWQAPKPAKSQHPHAAGLGSPRPTLFHYDKTENETTLLDPAFWTQFDYVLTAEPERVIGSWRVVATVFAYAGIEVLRPGQTPTALLPPEGRIWESMRARVNDGHDVHATEASAPASAAGHDADAAKAATDPLGPYYAALRDVGRRDITGGWWVGPRMEPKISILRWEPRV
ncbi:MAG: dolichyl-P-Man:Man(7)GlcNAc(2)-PP-dolichol alpha-1,6-mannosyltransferase [Claussenomyces sp. TS43310]|nr:MAG: dolichyl-P-Man:Man(7)GlcNAc(2)-PP-dolichol alpha-1,6-mannosyltransferase [Claussenomyces sp. TS43310]